MENQLAKIYNLIANKLNEMIPTKWNHIYLLGEVEKEQISYSATFYFSESESHEIIRCFKIPEKYKVSEEIYNQLHKELVDLVLELNNCFKNYEQEVWDQVIFDLDSEGKFNVKFNYDAMNENDGGEIRREVIWAYEMFKYVPKDSKYFNKVLDKYLEEKEKQ